MKQEKQTAPLLGGSSLLAVFGVLCLTVLALLTLTTVTAQQRLSQSSLDAITAYYEADTQAEQIFASLRSGSLPPQVEQEGEIYRYQCPISQNRTLFVELRRSGDSWQVLRWQEVAAPLEIDDSMPVWAGK